VRSKVGVLPPSPAVAPSSAAAAVVDATSKARSRQPSGAVPTKRNVQLRGRSCMQPLLRQRAAGRLGDARRWQRADEGRGQGEAGDARVVDETSGQACAEQDVMQQGALVEEVQQLCNACVRRDGRKRGRDVEKKSTIE
jgi:hypothetical protein